MGERFWAAWFTAVTPRTAGFNTVDTAGLGVPAMLLVMFLMFIGGGSNSTASGIKVSTFMVLLLSTRAFLMGNAQTTIFRRAVARDAVFRAHAVVMLSLILLALAGFILVVLAPKQAPLDVFFEAVSAFGTVGLSRGITATCRRPPRAFSCCLCSWVASGPWRSPMPWRARARPRCASPRIRCRSASARRRH